MTASCLLTGVPIRYDDPVYAWILVRNHADTESGVKAEPHTQWTPIGVPFGGTYDAHGLPARIRDPLNEWILLDGLRQDIVYPSAPSTLYDLLDQMLRDGVRIYTGPSPSAPTRFREALTLGGRALAEYLLATNGHSPAREDRVHVRELAVALAHASAAQAIAAAHPKHTKAHAAGARFLGKLSRFADGSLTLEDDVFRVAIVLGGEDADPFCARLDPAHFQRGLRWWSNWLVGHALLGNLDPDAEEVRNIVSRMADQILLNDALGYLGVAWQPVNLVRIWYGGGESRLQEARLRATHALLHPPRRPS